MIKSLHYPEELLKQTNIIMKNLRFKFKLYLNCFSGLTLDGFNDLMWIFISTLEYPIFYLISFTHRLTYKHVDVFFSITLMYYM